MAIDQETRERAEQLFVIDGMTLEEVAGMLDLSPRTVANWSVEGGWTAKRREYRNAASEIRRYATLTRLKLIKDAMTSLDPQKVYAFAALERVTNRLPIDDGRLSIGKTENGEQIPEREIKTPQGAILALQEAIELKLRVMLSRPDAINLGAIKEFKQAMEVLDGMKAKYGGKEEETIIEGYDEEQARFWREKVLKGR